MIAKGFIPGMGTKPFAMVDAWGYEVSVSPGAGVTAGAAPGWGLFPLAGDPSSLAVGNDAMRLLRSEAG